MTKRVIQTIVRTLGAIGSYIFLFQNLPEIITNDYLYIFLMAVVLLIAILFVVYDIKDLISSKHAFVESTRYSFNVPSKKHESFFAKWYSRPGKLTVYVESLAGWAQPTDRNDNPIFNALLNKAKANDLFLYIEFICEHVKHLENAGAYVYPLERSSRVEFSFSVIQSEILYSIILRDKTKDIPGKNAIDELSGSFVAKLIENLISNAR